MDSNATSLKKLKREAAQRRKAQARSLKLRAEEQERLQRLEIDALVEQQRVQRLERQRRKEDAEKLAREAHSLSLHSNNFPSNGNEASHTKGGKHTSTSTSTSHVQNVADGHKGGGEEGKKTKESKETKPSSKQTNNNNNNNTLAQLHKQQQQQQQEELQQQQVRAIAENRRKLAKGSSTLRGVLLDTSATPGGLICTSTSNGSSASVLPSEDHRVVSTEYQAAGTQALMRVTLLAAGFVIGARGISARLIGQVTGAILQSWTEPTACRPGNVNGSSSATTSVPIRLFRIQGKKSVVHSAVSLVEQAVAKYRELCECKRRGEFVQREHVINGVEFYYQPPPRKAFVVPDHSQAPRSSEPSLTATSTGSSPPGNIIAPVSVTTPDVPLANSIHHVWLQHLHQKQAQLQKQKEQQQQVEQVQESNKSVNLEDICDSPPSDGFSQAQGELQGQLQVQRPGTAESFTGSACTPPAWGSSGVLTSEQSSQQQHHVFQEESSLFSIFGNGGLPLPIAQDCPPPNVQFLKSSVSSTPFDFPKYDFFREVLPAFPPHPFQTPGEEYNLFSHHQLHQLPPVQPPEKQPFVVCVERPPPRFVEQ